MKWLPGRLPDVSLEGHRIDWLLAYASWATGILFGVLCAYLLYLALMRRPRAGRRAPYQPGLGVRHLVLICGISAVSFFALDGVLLARSYAELTGVFWKFPTNDPGAVRVEVVAQQWAFNFRYPGPDGKFDTPDDLVTFNDLHVPVGRPIFLKLRSKDVIHDFYLPSFRTKIDALPGSTTQLWFQATRTGRYEFGCAQLCGPFHYKMHGWMTVESAADYAAFIARANRAATLRYDAADRAAHWGWPW